MYKSVHVTFPFFLQLTAVVVSLIAVHDTKNILQDGWAQVEI